MAPTFRSRRLHRRELVEAPGDKVLLIAWAASKTISAIPL
jgi:hypothetical protein